MSSEMGSTEFSSGAKGASAPSVEIQSFAQGTDTQLAEPTSIAGHQSITDRAETSFEPLSESIPLTISEGNGEITAEEISPPDAHEAWFDDTSEALPLTIHEGNGEITAKALSPPDSQEAAFASPSLVPDQLHANVDLNPATQELQTTVGPYGSYSWNPASQQIGELVSVDTTDNEILMTAASNAQEKQSSQAELPKNVAEAMHVSEGDRDADEAIIEGVHNGGEQSKDMRTEIGMPHGNEHVPAKDVPIGDPLLGAALLGAAGWAAVSGSFRKLGSDATHVPSDATPSAASSGDTAPEPPVVEALSSAEGDSLSSSEPPPSDKILDSAEHKQYVRTQFANAADEIPGIWPRGYEPARDDRFDTIYKDVQQPASHFRDLEVDNPVALKSRYVTPEETLRNATAEEAANSLALFNTPEVRIDGVVDGRVRASIAAPNSRGEGGSEQWELMGSRFDDRTYASLQGSQDSGTTETTGAATGKSTVPAAGADLPPESQVPTSAPGEKVAEVLAKSGHQDANYVNNALESGGFEKAVQEKVAATAPTLRDSATTPSLMPDLVGPVRVDSQADMDTDMALNKRRVEDAVAHSAQQAEGERAFAAAKQADAEFVEKKKADDLTHVKKVEDEQEFFEATKAQEKEFFEKKRAVDLTYEERLAEEASEMERRKNSELSHAQRLADEQHALEEEQDGSTPPKSASHNVDRGLGG